MYLIITMSSQGINAPGLMETIEIKKKRREQKKNRIEEYQVRMGKIAQLKTKSTRKTKIYYYKQKNKTYADVGKLFFST